MTWRGGNCLAWRCPTLPGITPGNAGRREEPLTPHHASMPPTDCRRDPLPNRDCVRTAGRPEQRITRGASRHRRRGKVAVSVGWRERLLQVPRWLFVAEFWRCSSAQPGRCGAGWNTGVDAQDLVIGGSGRHRCRLLTRGEHLDDAELAAEGVLHHRPVDAWCLVAVSVGPGVEAGGFRSRPPMARMSVMALPGHETDLRPACRPTSEAPLPEPNAPTPPR